MTMSNEDFIGKLEWEGGLYDLALYGVKPEDLRDKALSKLWGEYLKRFEKLQETKIKIEELLELP